MSGTLTHFATLSHNSVYGIKFSVLEYNANILKIPIDQYQIFLEYVLGHRNRKAIEPLAIF
jgi:hypothetical protein